MPICGLCDELYSDNDPDDVARHEHPEPLRGPLRGPLRKAWLESGMLYEEWYKETPEGRQWAKYLSKFRGKLSGPGGKAMKIKSAQVNVPVNLRPKGQKPGWPVSPERAAAIAAEERQELETTADTWSPDDVIQASLALGTLRSAIDAVKAASDKLHRARKCPDRLLFSQINVADVCAVQHCAKELLEAYENMQRKLGARA